MINSWIVNSVYPTIVKQLNKSKLPKEVWKCLSCLYTQSYLAKRYQLKCEIKMLNNRHDLYIWMTELWDQPACMEPQFVCIMNATTFRKIDLFRSSWPSNPSLSVLTNCFFTDHHYPQLILPCPNFLLTNKNNVPNKRWRIRGPFSSVTRYFLSYTAM